jgi:hypothetical protein
LGTQRLYGGAPAIKSSPSTESPMRGSTKVGVAHGLAVLSALRGACWCAGRTYYVCAFTALVAIRCGGASCGLVVVPNAEPVRSESQMRKKNKKALMHRNMNPDLKASVYNAPLENKLQTVPTL